MSSAVRLALPAALFCSVLFCSRLALASHSRTPAAALFVRPFLTRPDLNSTRRRPVSTLGLSPRHQTAAPPSSTKPRSTVGQQWAVKTRRIFTSANSDLQTPTFIRHDGDFLRVFRLHAIRLLNLVDLHIPSAPRSRGLSRSLVRHRPHRHLRSVWRCLLTHSPQLSLVAHATMC